MMATNVPMAGPSTDMSAKMPAAWFTDIREAFDTILKEVAESIRLKERRKAREGKKERKEGTCALRATCVAAWQGRQSQSDETRHAMSES